MTGILFSSLWVWCLLLWKIENKTITLGNISIDGRIAYLICTWVPIFFVMGARSAEVGTDTWNYAMNIFPTVVSYGSIDNILSEEDSFGKLYWLFFYYLGNIFSSKPEVYIIGESFIIALGMCIFFYRTTNHVALSTMIFLCCFFVTSLSAARQFVGIVIGINAAVFIIKNNKSIIGWVLFFITTQIHAVNAIILLAIILGVISIKYKKITKTFFFSAAVIILFGTATELILSVFIGAFLPEYLGYLNTAWSQNVLEGEAGYGTGVMAANLIYFIAVLLFTVKFKRISESLGEKSQLYYAFLPAAVIGSLAGMIFSSSMVMPRLFYSFVILGIPLVAECPYYYVKIERFLITLFIIAGSSVGFYRVFLAHEYIYTFFWEL